MSDLFDLPFEDEDESQESVVESRESGVESRESGVESRESTPRLPTADSRLPTTDHQLPSPTRRVLSVTELTVRVRDLLEGELFEIWVEGELSNCRIWNTGHLYFTLKDSAAQLRGFMFKSTLP